MIRLTAWLCIGLPLFTFGLPSRGAAQATKQAASPALDAATSKRVAENVVTKTARVRPGELVVISGGEHDLQLLEDLAVAVRKAGGHSIIDYGSDRLARRMFDEVPASLDTMRPQLKTLPITDVFIGTDYLDPATLAGVDPARLETVQKANAPFREALKSWKGRSVTLGNGLYPTPGGAKQAGVSVAQLAAVFRAGLDVDYDALERTAEAVRAALAHGSEIHLTAANGTDLHAKIAGQKSTPATASSATRTGRGTSRNAPPISRPVRHT